MQQHHKTGHGKSPGESLDAMLTGACITMGHGDGGPWPGDIGQEQPGPEADVVVSGKFHIQNLHHTYLDSSATLFVQTRYLMLLSASAMMLATRQPSAV